MSSKKIRPQRVSLIAIGAVLLGLAVLLGAIYGI